jgi:NTP pyrophosphatase (non-canonical NTP hydrolase)
MAVSHLYERNDYGFTGKKHDVKEELADVINYAIRMASVLDIYSIVMDKLEKNERKYPAEKRKAFQQNTISYKRVNK